MDTRCIWEGNGVICGLVLLVCAMTECNPVDIGWHARSDWFALPASRNLAGIHHVCSAQLLNYSIWKCVQDNGYSVIRDLQIPRRAYFYSVFMNVASD